MSKTSELLRWGLCFLFFVVATTSGARTWKSASGASIEADFVQEYWGQVTLMKEDGSEVKIRLGQLSAEDQTYIRSGKAKEEALVAASGGDGEEGDPTGNAPLPALPMPNQEYHAIVKKQAYTAKLRIDGNLEIELATRKPLPSSPHILPPKSMILNRKGFWYYIPKADTATGRAKHVNRKITEITSSIPPSMNPKQVVMTGVAEDGVEFTYEITFDNDGFCWSMELDDPKDIKYPSHWAWSMRTPPTHKFGPEVELEEQKKATEGYYVELKAGDNTEQPMWKSMRRGVHGVDQLIIHGMYPGVAVRIDAKGAGSKFNAGPGYAGKPLYPGVYVVKHLNENTGKVTACMTFEPDMGR